jgi:hypothetical protein
MPQPAPLQTPPPIVSLTRRELPAKKLVGTPPVIDGILGDGEWKEAARAEQFTDQQARRLATDQTVAYLAYDEKFLYIAFECHDSQPEGIVGRELVRDARYQRDGVESSEDSVEVTFEPFLTYKDDDFSSFSVNPLGTRSAALAGGRARKAEWNGDWDATAKRTSTGWSAELRIPWQTISYPTGKRGESRTFAVNFSRFQYRTQTTSLWSDTGVQGFNDQVGRWVGVEPPVSAHKPTLSLLPYALGFGGKTNRGQIGLDARYQPTPELTVVGSANPDFATVEGAIQNINFSRSERFVEERRPFFLEGADYFSAGQFFALGPLFYSNRIQKFDLGAKAFGKITPKDTLGVLVTEDFGQRTDAVVRYRHDLTPTTQFGVFGTLKEEKGDRNAVMGFSGGTRRKKFGLDTQLLASGGTDSGGRAGAVNFQYFDGNHFTSVQYKAVSPTFRDANGLVFFNDFKGFAGYHNWSREWRKGAWRSFSVDFFPTYNWHYDGRPFQRGGGMGMTLQTRSDWELSIGGDHTRFDGQLDRTINFGATSGVTNRFRRFEFNVTTGTQGGAMYREWSPGASVRLARRTDIGYQAALIEQNGWQHQHILTLSRELSRTRGIGGRLVRQREPGKKTDTNFYLSYRSAGERGTESYVLLGDPNAKTFQSQVAVKLIWAH